MWSRRNSRVLAAIFLLCAAGPGALACARSHDRPRGGEEARDDGDSAQAFADITVRVQAYDGFDDPSATVARTPSTQSAYVFVSRGGRDGRIPELRVFHGDAELREVGSAGVPQQFSYQGIQQPVSETPNELRLRLGEASFSHPLEISDVQLTAPEKGEELTTRGEFRVRWTGVAPPKSLGVTPVPDSTCELIFRMETRSEDEAVFAVTPRPDLETSPFLGLGTRSCRADVIAQWELEDEQVTDTPFGEFVIARRAKRTRRFLLTLWR